MKRFFIIIATVFLLFSCSEDKSQQPAQNAAPSLFEQVREQTKTNPQDRDAWFHLADLYERAEAYQEEADALKKVVTIKPDDGYSYFKLGTTYNRLGRYQEAIASFQKAEKYIPRNPVLYNNMAVAYGKTGKTDKEIESLKRAISLRPRYVTARYNLAATYLKKGNRQEALKQYDIIKQIDEGAAASLKKEIDQKKEK